MKRKLIGTKKILGKKREGRKFYFFSNSFKLPVFISINLWLIFFAFAFAAQAQTRAVWVRPFIGASEEIRKDATKGREFVRRELEQIKRADLNTIYLETFWDGYTIYPSKFALQRPLAIPYGVAHKDAAGQNTTWDVLQIYLDEGAKLNLKIHAWLHIFHQWNTNLGGLEKSPIFKQFPEWAMLDKNGSPFVKAEAEGANRDIYKIFISPANPAARKFLRQIVGEIARKYPKLVGIQWDYIRYPLQPNDAPFDYNPLTLKAFQKETGLDAKKLDAQETPKEWRTWQDWKAGKVTEVVHELGEIVRNLQPQWEISAAVFPNIEENLRLKQQNWKLWSQKNYIDALLPMLYSRDFTRVENWAKDFRRDVSPKTKIYPALFIGHFYNSKDKKLDERYLRLAQKSEFGGFGLFAAQSLTDDLIEKLSRK